MNKQRPKKRGRPRSARPSMPPEKPRTPKKRKQWSEESMLGALDAVKNGTPVLYAAREHGVPRQTLNDRISGRVVHGTKPGPKPYLSQPEEKELSFFS